MKGENTNWDQIPGIPSKVVRGRDDGDLLEEDLVLLKHNLEYAADESNWNTNQRPQLDSVHRREQAFCVEFAPDVT